MLTKEQLLSPKTRIVVLGSLGEVEIRKLKLFEINPHGSKKQKESETDQAYRLISTSLVNPELTPVEVKDLEFDVFNQLQEAVLNYNGMSEEAETDISKN